MDDRVICERGARYEAFWGRKSDFVWHPDNDFDPHIDVYRFPPVRCRWFFQKWFKPMDDKYVYITGGMSDRPMNRQAEARGPSRIELVAYTDRLYVDESGELDVTAHCLYGLAREPHEQGIFYGPFDTISAPAPIVPGSEMTAFLLSVVPSAEMGRLRSCTVNAELVLEVVPISKSEVALAKDKGPESLLDYFESSGVKPVFDLDRAPTL